MVFKMAGELDIENNEAFVRGFHGIPDPGKLNAMSFAELASLRAECEKDSPKFLVVEREIKRHRGKDHAEINRRNILVGALIAGVFTVVGAVGGAFIGGRPVSQSVSRSLRLQRCNSRRALLCQMSQRQNHCTRPNHPHNLALMPATSKNNAQPANAKP